MENRDEFLTDFRGDSIGYLINESTFEELFQNEVLRPILVLQNELFIAVFKNYILKNKILFDTYSNERKRETIANVIHKDIKFRNTLRGIVIGLFTLEEFENYASVSTSLNKRMMDMLIERLKSQIELL